MAEPATPVLIVGGGPVGMTLAMALDALGVRSMVVNTEPGVRRHPKGATQNARTMEHYRRYGISARLRQMGLPLDHPTDVGYFTRLVSYELARLTFPSEREKQETVARADATDQVPEPILRLNQMHCEQLLLDHIKTLPGVTVRFGWRCCDFTDGPDGVMAEIEEVETGARESVRASYLIGCDGAHGMVRRKLGLKYVSGADNTPRGYMNGRMVQSYVRVPRFFEQVPHRKCWQYWILNAETRGMFMVVDGSDDLGFSTTLRNPEDKRDPALIAHQFRACFGADVEFTFHDHIPWTAGHALVAEKFGRGRVILCGDSAHLFSPTGGFGLNTGNDDAVNLAWKLAAVVQGWGGPKLMATYESERRPIATRNTGAGRSFVRGIGATPIGEAIDENSDAGRADRRKAGDFLSGFTEEFASLGIQLGARCDGSPIIEHDGVAPSADDPHVYTPSSVPGGRAPHLWLHGHISLYDRLGKGFTLIRFAKSNSDVRAIETAAKSRGVPLKTIEVDLDAGRELYQRDLALIRPDMYVAWRGDRLPEDCDALLARVTGF
jgi:2-polyprenyl-6-methoxyphenol hydroxylase-like FAD-dependent oxidoreductase